MEDKQEIPEMLLEVAPIATSAILGFPPQAQILYNDCTKFYSN